MTPFRGQHSMSSSISQFWGYISLSLLQFLTVEANIFPWLCQMSLRKANLDWWPFNFIRLKGLNLSTRLEPNKTKFPYFVDRVSSIAQIWWYISFSLL